MLDIRWDENSAIFIELIFKIFSMSSYELLMVYLDLKTFKTLRYKCVEILFAGVVMYDIITRFGLLFSLIEIVNVTLDKLDFSKEIY